MTTCCDKLGLKKGPWTPEEDRKLLAYIQQHGHGSWRALPPKAGLRRCGKSCRLRWTNYLRPDIKRGEFSLQEQQTIIQLHALLGNKWSAIASHLPKRTDNEIKNYWNTHLKKRLTKMGIDPTTHKPKSLSGHTKDVANLSHMAQWEAARLEAEARIVRESKMHTSDSSSTYHRHRNATKAAAAAASSATRPACLDILKVWQGTWLGKDKKEVSFVNGFFGQLESPTSILSFSDNNMLLQNVVVPSSNIVHENTILNYGETLGACTIGDEELKGMMGDSATTNDCFPDFLEDYGEIPTSGSAVGNYWNNILNSVGSPIHSTVF